MNTGDIDLWDIAVDIAPNGDFLIAQANAEGCATYQYTADGSLKSGATIPSQGGTILNVDVAVNPGDGRYVVVDTIRPAGSSMSHIEYWLYSAGNELLWSGIGNLASLNESSAFNAHVDWTRGSLSLTTETFLIAWELEKADGDRDVYATSFHSQGYPLTAEVPIAATALNESGPEVGFASDVFKWVLNERRVVAWTQSASDGSNPQVYFSVFDSLSLTTGATQQLVGSGDSPSVAGNSDGQYIIAWQSDSTTIRAQRFNIANNPVGAEIVITGDKQLHAPRVSMGNGQILLAYGEESNGNIELVYQLFSGDGTPLGAPGRFGNPPLGTEDADAAMNANGEFVLLADVVDAPHLRFQKFLPAESRIAAYDPNSATFYLKDSLSGGNADVTFVYGGKNWIPLVGDWDGDGIDTPGVYVPSTATFYLRNSNTGGYGDIECVYGRSNWIPIVGDWDGDGKDTIGVYEPGRAIFYLKNSLAGGDADIGVNYGGANWQPLAGDWDGDGKDTIGAYEPGRAIFYLKNSLAGGNADVAFAYGGPNWTAIAGDWDGDGKDTIGAYESGRAIFYLKNSLTGGYSDVDVNYGRANWKPLAGDWDGPAVASLMTIVDALPGQVFAKLTATEAQPLLSAAAERWKGAAAVVALDDVLAKARVAIADLPAGTLGQAIGDTIYLDGDAAGHGWFIDPTPALDEEFHPLSNGGSLRAVDPRAVDRIDLLSVIEHELGHLAGLADLDDLDSVMGKLFAPGVRRSVQ